MANQDLPREPVYSFGPVKLQGGKGKNHAKYIDKNGSYDIVRFLKDHASIFPTINRVWQLVSYVRTSLPMLIGSHYSVSQSIFIILVEPTLLFFSTRSLWS